MFNPFTHLHKSESLEFKPPKSLFEDTIHGDKFASIADISIQEDTFFRPDNLDIHTDTLLFCSTVHLEKIFNIIGSLKQKFVLITHNSDINITENIYRTKPVNVVAWFGQNIATSKPDLFPIPIGLERPHLNPGVRDVGVIATTALEKKIVNAWAYMSHRNCTNAKVRRTLMWLYRWRPYVTYRRKKEKFLPYIQNLHRHRFVFSPEGNGIDCHRTWEALYLGTIPIVKDGPWRIGFENLPMLALESLTNVSFEKLKQAWKPNELIEKNYFEKLTFSYWRNVIHSTCLQRLYDWKPCSKV